jgi:SAM-dependent methyltransferase
MNPTLLERLIGSRAEVTALGDFLRRMGYSSGSICAELGIPGPPYQLLTSTAYCSFVYYDEARARHSDIAAVAMLFALGGWVEEEAYSRALPAEVRSIAERFGLIEAVGECSCRGSQYLRATIGIAEYGSRFFVSDRMLERSPESIRLTQEGRDHVDPPGRPSVTVLRNALRSPSSPDLRLLDVGCGTGCQAIIAGDHYRDLMGIDINPRAVQFSRLNAVLNGVAIEFRQEDCLLFESADKFDRIVFNVPSVPRYKPDLDKIDTYTSDLGHTLALEFIDSRLPSLLREEGSCSLWSVFAIRCDERTIEGVLRRGSQRLEMFDLEIVVEQRSPFGLSSEQIQERKVPRGSYLLADPSHDEALLDFLARNDVVRVTPALVTLTFRKSSESRVLVREVETLLPDLRQ